MQTLKVKIAVEPEQSEALLETMHQFNAACNYVAEIAFQMQTADKIKLQPFVYHDIREKIDKARIKLDDLRASMQSCGTDSAKKHLKKLSGHEARFRRDTNHCISKKLVMKAKGTSSLIVLEDLQGIRERTTVQTRAQRHRHSSWSFSQLRQFIDYKAVMSGVGVVCIDPAYTSQECPICHHISRSNRPTRDEFCCVCCGFSGPADTVAARNIAARVSVNMPIVARFFAELQAQNLFVGS